MLSRSCDHGVARVPNLYGALPTLARKRRKGIPTFSVFPLFRVCLLSREEVEEDHATTLALGLGVGARTIRSVRFSPHCFLRDTGQRTKKALAPAGLDITHGTVT